MDTLKQTEASQKSGLTKMAAVKFLPSEVKQQKLDPFFSFRSVDFTQHLDSNVMQRCFKVWRVLRDIFFLQ